MDCAEIAGFKVDLLGRDICQFGKLLEDAIRAKPGNEVFDRIKSIHLISVQFANTAQAQHHIRRARAHRVAASAPKHRSLAYVFAKLITAESANVFKAAFADARITPFFSRTPTELQRKNILNRQMSIARLIGESGRTSFTPAKKTETDETLKTSGVSRTACWTPSWRRWSPNKFTSSPPN